MVATTDMIVLTGPRVFCWQKSVVTVEHLAQRHAYLDLPVKDPLIWIETTEPPTGAISQLTFHLNTDDLYLFDRVGKKSEYLDGLQSFTATKQVHLLHARQSSIDPHDFLLRLILLQMLSFGFTGDKSCRNNYIFWTGGNWKAQQTVTVILALILSKIKPSETRTSMHWNWTCRMTWSNSKTELSKATKSWRTELILEWECSLIGWNLYH